VGYIAGAESLLLQILRQLPSNIRPAVLCPELSPLADEISNLNIPIFNWPFKRIYKWQLMRFGKGIQLVNKILKQEKFDIIHAHSFQSAVHISLAAKLNHIPVVSVVQDIMKFSRTSIWLLDRSDKIVVVSEATGKNLLNKNISSEKLMIILNGFDFDEINSIKHRKSPSVKGGNIVYVGQLSPSKGIDILLEAFKIVRKELPNSSLTIIGEDLAYQGKYKEEYMRLAQELGLTKNVIFTGYIKDVFSEFEDKDVLVLPSRIEPFGRVLVEAMAYGLPVVASAVDGIPEIVNSEAVGKLVPREDPEALAEGIIQVLEEGGTKSQRAVEGRKHVRAEFPISKTVDEYIKLYYDLAAENENRC